jgi:glucan phosphoethanolaminetransferase (alkaline phosphatase superfamily)
MIVSPTVVVLAVAVLFGLFFMTKLIKPTKTALTLFFVCAVIVAAMLTLSGRTLAAPSEPTTTQTGDVQAPYLPWGYNIRNGKEWVNKLVK